MHFIGRNNILKLKSNKYHTLRTVPILNRQIVENIKIDTTNTEIHDRSLLRLGTGTSITNVMGTAYPSEAPEFTTGF